jgi:hypothetical protein
VLDATIQIQQPGMRATTKVPFEALSGYSEITNLFEIVYKPVL